MRFANAEREGYMTWRRDMVHCLTPIPIRHDDDEGALIDHPDSDDGSLTDG